MATGFGFGHAFPLGMPNIIVATSGSASSMGTGYFYNDDSFVVTPLNIDGNWIPSISQVSSSLSRLNDVGVNDHTTYHQGASGAVSYIKALYVFPAPVTLEAYTFSMWREAPSVRIWYSLDGSNWTSWDIPLVSSFVTHAWVDVSANPADVVGRYVQIILTDTSALDPPSLVRIADWRIVSS